MTAPRVVEAWSHMPTALEAGWRSFRSNSVAMALYVEVTRCASMNRSMEKMMITMTGEDGVWKPDMLVEAR